MSCSLFSILYFFYSLLYYLLFYLLFALFYNTLSTRCSNQLRTSGSFFSPTTVLCVSQSRLFLILSQFIILPYILPLVNCLTLSIFIYVLLFFIFIMTVIIIIILMMMMMIIINIIILCASSKYVKRCKI